MNDANTIIWVLTDNRPGNNSQSIGLAENLAKRLSAKIQIKQIKYNLLGKIPNFLKINGMAGISKTSRDYLLNQIEKPTIIIAAGRKNAPILAFLKKHYQAFSIQIMNPNFSFSKFNLIILPHHDDKKFNRENVLRITGSLTRIDEELLKNELDRFSNILGKINSPKIALLIGGSSKKGHFTDKIAIDLGKIVNNLANNMNAHILALSSRRTGDKITQIIDKNLNCSKTFFKWKSKGFINPYFAALQASDFIIATGDSISMCSEICCLGKPVYIFNPEEICPDKHLKFHQNLFEGGFAKKLDEKVVKLDNYLPEKLDETNRIAKIITNEYLI
jgi:hypothetical protein